MSNQQELTFFARQETYYAGSNPEMADMANPAGEIYHSCWVVLGEDDEGNQYTYLPKVFREVDYVMGEAEIEALKMAHAFCVRASKGHVPTLDGKIWRYRGPSYGSKAYLDEEMGIVAKEIADDMYGCSR
jgi:hypothetical protein